MKNTLILFCLFAFSCSGAGRKTNPEVGSVSNKTEQPGTMFAKYLSLIPNLTLPFEKHCNDLYTFPDIDRNSKYVSKYIPGGASILGKIDISKNAFGIIYTFPADYIYPVLQTYAKDGQVLDKLDLLTKYCGRDYDFYSSSSFRIDGNLNLVVIDSILTYQLDDEDEIAAIAKSEIIKTYYTIAPDGKIGEKN
jgi:hypothetical protein